MRLIVCQHIPVGVPADERSVVELGEPLDHLDRLRSEHHEITDTHHRSTPRRSPSPRTASSAPTMP